MSALGGAILPGFGAPRDLALSFPLPSRGTGRSDVTGSSESESESVSDSSAGVTAFP